MNAVRITIIEARPVEGTEIKVLVEQEFPGAIVTFLHALPRSKVIADLILCSCCIREMGKSEFLEALQKLVCLAPILVYGIKGDSHAAEQCLQAGADGALLDGASSGEIKKEMRALFSLSHCNAADSEAVLTASSWPSSPSHPTRPVIAGASEFA